MPTRRMHNLTVLLLILTMTGCAPYPPIESSIPADTNQSAAVDALRTQTKALEEENAGYEKRIADQQEEIAVMSKSLSDQQGEIAVAQKRVSELNKSMEELNTQVKQLQDARQKETPLKETELVPAKKAPVKPSKPAWSPKKNVPMKSPAAKGRGTEAADDLKALTKQSSQSNQKSGPQREDVPVVKKGTATQGETGKELKKDKQKESAEPKAAEPRSVDDLSAQMREFEEAGLKAAPPQETAPAPAKKEPGKSAKNVKPPAKDARTEVAEGKARASKAVRIKVLAGDGNIDSAKKMSTQLGKMGYRVKAIDRAPRSDFDANTVYYGPEYRVTAEAMVKTLGKGAVTRPLNWSSTFDIIVVTGRRQ
jgi:Skp family chaperone for outer membrane proteins